MRPRKIGRLKTVQHTLKLAKMESSLHERWRALDGTGIAVPDGPGGDVLPGLRRPRRMPQPRRDAIAGGRPGVHGFGWFG